MSFANMLKTGREVRKRLGRPDLPDPWDVNGIYQMRSTNRGRVPIRMQFYTPTNPRTTAQQANREKFKQANSAYYSLTPEERALYSKRARKVGLHGWNLFIKDYYKTH